METIHPDEIDYAVGYERKQLADAIKAAYVAVGKAQRAQVHLVNLYDVEYVEDGGRLASFLADADKALYAAQLIVEKRNAVEARALKAKPEASVSLAREAYRLRQRADELERS